MKTKKSPITQQGLITLTIDPVDKVAWKLTMLQEAANTPRGSSTIKQIAKKYGYSREHFHKIKNQYEEGGTLLLQDKAKGPQKNYVRTQEVEKQIIRHRFLDPEANCEVIAQKMNQSGYRVSQRSVERTINEYGLQKKGYIKHLRKHKSRTLRS